MINNLSYISEIPLKSFPDQLSFQFTMATANHVHPSEITAAVLSRYSANDIPFHLIWKVAVM